MNYRNHMRLEMAGLAENVSFSRIVVAAFASQLGFTLDEIEEIKVAVSEAVSNAIIHGYQDQPGETVGILALIEEGRLEIQVEDTGVGIANIEQAMQPAYTTCSGRMGLGFSFMQSFMDQIRVESAINQGTRIYLQKTVKAVSPAAAAEH